MSGRGTVGVALAAAAVTLAACSSVAGDSGRAVRPASAARAASVRPAPRVTSTGRTDAAAGIARTPTPAARAVAAQKAVPCAANHEAQLVLVSVRQQHLWLCAWHRLVRDTPVTTGAVALPYRSTPTGAFTIQAHYTDQVLTLVDGAQYTVKYWIPFDAPLFGFHDSPWQTMPYGSPRYRTQGSHGCVHLPAAAMRFLYRWARVGATVRIRP